MTSPPSAFVADSLLLRRILDGLLLLLALLYAIAIPYQSVHIDEPWFGEVAYRVANEGVPRSVLFTGLARYEERITMAHKLFIYLGAVATLVFGWHLWSLRLVSLLAGGLLIWLLYRHLKDRNETGYAQSWRIGLLFLLATPLFFRYVNMYRPEVLLALCGFASYHWLARYLSLRHQPDLLLSTLFAGLSPLVHPNGLMFIGAGIVLLAFARRFRALMIFVPLSLAIAALYFWDIIGHWELFRLQVHENPALHTSAFDWFGPVLRLLDEHKRLFRNPEVIFGTILFIAAVTYALLRSRARISHAVVYALAAIIGLGMISQRKTTSYALTVYPFFAVVIAEATVTWLASRNGRWPRFSALGAMVWGAFLIHGLASNSLTAITGKQSPARQNHRLAAYIPDGSRVSAPLDFVFDEIDRYEIRGQEAVRMLLAKKEPVRVGDIHRAYHAIHYLQAADSAGIPYIILEPHDLERSEFRDVVAGSSLGSFEVLYVDPATGRAVAVHH